MGNRLSFYFSQGSKNLKNSVLIVLGLSLALSMVSGISLYIDSYQRNLVNESFGQILDFNVIYREHQFLDDRCKGKLRRNSAPPSGLLAAIKVPP